MSASHTAVKWTSLGYFQVAITSVAQTLAQLGIAIPNDTVMIVIGAEVAAIRYRYDGTAPTATVGRPLNVGQEISLSLDDFSKLRFIQQAAGARLNVDFHK